MRTERERYRDTEMYVYMYIYYIHLHQGTLSTDLYQMRVCSNQSLPCMLTSCSNAAKDEVVCRVFKTCRAPRRAQKPAEASSPAIVFKLLLLTWALRFGACVRSVLLGTETCDACHEQRARLLFAGCVIFSFSEKVLERHTHKSIGLSETLSQLLEPKASPGCAMPELNRFSKQPKPWRLEIGSNRS